MQEIDDRVDELLGKAGTHLESEVEYARNRVVHLHRDPVSARISITFLSGCLLQESTGTPEWIKRA